MNDTRIFGFIGVCPGFTEMFSLVPNECKDAWKEGHCSVVVNIERAFLVFFFSLLRSFVVSYIHANFVFKDKIIFFTEVLAEHKKYDITQYNIIMPWHCKIN